MSFVTFEKVCLAYTRRTREESVGDNTPGTPREVAPVPDFVLYLHIWMRRKG